MSKLFILLLLFPLLLLGCQKEEEGKAGGKKNIRTESVFRLVESFSSPEALAGSGETLLLAERSGRIWKIEDEEKELWADLSPRTGPGGLRGIALSPDWGTDRLFYVFLENRGQAQVLFEGVDTGDGGVVRREVLRLPDKTLSPGPIAFLGKDLLVSVGGEPRASSWAGSLLRIRPFLGDGEAYSVRPGREEVWIPGFGDVTSLSPSTQSLLLSKEEELLRLDLPVAVSSAKKVPIVAESPCLRGGARQGGKFLYVASCQGEVRDLRSKETVARLPGLRLLQSIDGDVWGIGKSRLYLLEER